MTEALTKAQERPDLQPGFWPNYREPTPLARAIQYPLADPNWQSRVLNGYVRRAALATKENSNAE